MFHIRPDDARIRQELRLLVEQRRQMNQPGAVYDRQLPRRPDFATAYSELGHALLLQGQLEDTISNLRQALQIGPELSERHHYLGLALSRQGKLAEATFHYRRAIEMKPDAAQVHYQLGVALARQYQLGEARRHLTESGALDVNIASIMNNQAWITATNPDAKLRDPKTAVLLAEVAVELSSSQDPNVLDTLAAAYAVAGQFDRAVVTARSALALASKGNDNESLGFIRERASSANDRWASSAND